MSRSRHPSQSAAGRPATAPTRVRATVASAVAMVVVLLPALLTATLSVPIRSELGFDERGLGVSVATFFAASALSSAGGGWLAHRIGPRASVAVGVATSVAATAAIGLLATRLGHLLVLLSVAGIANAVTQPGAGLVLATVIPTRQQGLAFGVSQMSAPLASVLAGVAMPTIALTVGWRWAFAVPLLLGILLVVIWPRVAPATDAAPLQGHSGADAHARRLDLLALAAVTALAATAVQAMTAFFVESAIAAGVAAGAAGWLLGGGSLCGVVMRVAYGWVADRRDGDRLGDVAALMMLGAAGLASLAAGSSVLLVPATVLAFAAGWGWNGLLNYAVVRRYPHASALALGVVTTGVFVGGTLGPLSFGLLASHTGYPLAWTAAAALLLLAGVLLRLMARGRGSRQRPPRS